MVLTASSPGIGARVHPTMSASLCKTLGNSWIRMPTVWLELPAASHSSISGDEDDEIKALSAAAPGPEKNISDDGLMLSLRDPG